MGKEEEIRAALRKLAGEVGPETTLIGQVEGVNEDEKTCSIFDEETGLTYQDIRLRPVIDGDESMTLFPEPGTWAVAIRLEGGEDWVMTHAQKVYKWRLKIANAEIEQTADGLSVKNGGDSLKDVLKLIIEAVLKVVVIQGQNPDYVKLNQALVKLNKILK